MLPKETVFVDTTRPHCDGAAEKGAANGIAGPLGHPRVYLSLADRPAIDCPYCGRRFEKIAGANQGVH